MEIVSQVVQSRKRKLCELFAVTTSPDPVPQRPNLHLIHEHDHLHTTFPLLARFLDLNDLTNKTYFDPSTLPPRSYNASAQQRSQPLQPPSTASPTRDAQRIRSPAKGAAKASPQPPPAQTEDDTDQYEPIADLPTQSSQPYEEQKRSQETLQLGSPEHRGPELLVNGSGKEQEEDGIHLESKEEKQSEKLRPPDLQTTWAESVSSPSSTAGLHSNNTSRVDGHSPDTSPDEDGVQEATDDQQSSRSHKSPSSAIPRENANEGPPVSEHSPRPREERTVPEEIHAAENATNKLPLDSKRSLQKSPQRSVSADLQSKMDIQRQGESQAPIARDNEQGLQGEMPRQTQKAPVEGEVNSTSRGTDSYTASPGHRSPEEHRLNKLVDSRDWDDSFGPPSRRKRRRRSNEAGQTYHSRATAVILREVPDKRLNTLSSAAQKSSAIQDARGPTMRKDYMYILFLRQALENLFNKTDLLHTLSSSAKTLTTGDWQACLSERQDCAVVRRIYEWQQNGRWVLRQMKPLPEPAVPQTHQNTLMNEMRWLHTDFREERKAKLSVASQLAEWCQDWILSSTERRAALQLKTTRVLVSPLNMVQSPMDLSSGNVEDPDNDSPITASDINLPSTSAMQSTEPVSLFDPSKLLPNFGNRDLTTNDALVSHIPSCSLRLSDETHISSWGEVVQPDFLQPAVDQARRQDMGTSAESSGRRAEVEASLPPEDNTSALFQPESELMKKRLNAPSMFKLPMSQMPSQSFYELRKASQWTAEDDHNLRTYVRDFPSNWELISDRMQANSRSLFTPNTQRRAPWECYERLLQLESQASEAGNRPFIGPAGQFQRGLEKIKMRYDAQQQMQQHAQNAGQPAMPQWARFPSPIRVEKKVNRKFVGMIEAARKLARKREQAHQDGTATGQRPAVAIVHEGHHSPRYYSRLKYDKQVQESRRQEQKNEQIRQHQRAMLQAQQRQQQQSGNQPLYNSTLAQRMGNQIPGMSNGTTVTANGHLAVPGSNHVRSLGGHPMSMRFSHNMTSSNPVSQTAMGGRPPSSAPGHQRLAPPYGPQGPTMSDHSIQHIMQQAQQQQARNNNLYQGQRQSLQSQYGHGSPNLSNTSSLPNPNAVNQYNNYNNSTALNGRSPEPSSALHQSPSSTNPSPEMAHPMPASNNMQYHSNSGRQQQNASQPSTLSSGHVPTVNAVHHQIAQQNPHLSTEEVRQRASDQLKNMIAQSQRNALNAAAGGAHSQLPQQHQQLPGATTTGPSTYGATSQASPTMANGTMTGVSSQGHRVGGANVNSASADMQAQSGLQYQQQIHRQMHQLNTARNGLLNNSPHQPNVASPAMSQIGLQPYQGRTPTPGGQMRPPSSGGGAAASAYPNLHGMNLNLGMASPEDHIGGSSLGGSMGQQGVGVSGMNQSPTARPRSMQGHGGA